MPASNYRKNSGHVNIKVLFPKLFFVAEKLLREENGCPASGLLERVAAGLQRAGQGVGASPE